MADIINIAIERLHPHPQNPRKDLGDLTELTDSLKVNGVLQNLTVVPETPGDPNTDYTVIIGHRRLAAAQAAGLTEMPCSVVDMTPAKQIETMLVENMQRSDLTPYEQAQGFQMMLDLGGTISSVAAGTGFSETTIRRRVKLLELDPKEFKKSEARGATLFDYMELDKVDDPKEKNKLLKVIGTPDFKAKLEKAVNEQKKAKRKAYIVEILSSFAEQVEGVDNTEYAYVNGPDYWSDKPIEIPEDAKTRKYIFTANSWGCSLYRKKDKADLDKAAEREAVWKQEQAERNARKLAAQEVIDRCAKLRRDFVMGLSSTACKKAIPAAVAALVASSFNFEKGFDEADLRTVCPDLNVDTENEEVTIEQVMAALCNDSQAIVRLAYLNLESGDGYTKGWGDYDHEENEELDMCYKFLAMLGYEMSEEEKKFQDGTHEIFKQKEE